MDEKPEPKYHPAPIGQASNPAEAVEITYLTDVTSPDFKSGKKDETKAIERHWAEQLVAEGYAKFVEKPAAAVAETAVVEHAEPIAESETHHVDSES